MLKTVLFLLLVATPALADPSYLIFPDQPSCLARSAQQAQVLDTTGVTRYWWDCSTGPLQAGTVDGQAILAGSYAMSVQDSGPYGASATIAGNTAGLTANEQAELIPQAHLAPLIPSPGG